ncbi:uncharacterized protein LOC115742038 [Rhodamnia argentea]|uniref:Uncharacterized protein LOC115742038 n=1 Tax=Rhodamnia argentea TaxID=178133 RepID=A0A8B8PD73_9MYRT|nr:uncharacterized protein LOC115742038 [Rhodamnia argentea]
MDWLQPRRRRGPEWKQGWTNQTLASMSAPPLHLLFIFFIAVSLLWFSGRAKYEAQLRHSTLNLQLLLFLLPLLAFLFASLYSGASRLNYLLSWRQPRHPMQPHLPGGGVGGGGDGGGGMGVPWGVAIFVVLLLVMVSYHQSFQSMWFGPLRRSD